MAMSGKKVLLIDSDFRGGHLNQYFGLSRNHGWAESISGAIPIQQAIHRNVTEHLDFLTTGSLPPNPSEFLLHPNFSSLLHSVSALYDLVIICPPPILAVSDALIIGAHAGAVFILTRADVTTNNDINESIKRLNQAGISPQGLLFNDLKVRTRQSNDHNHTRQLRFAPR